MWHHWQVRDSRTHLKVNLEAIIFRFAAVSKTSRGHALFWKLSEVLMKCLWRALALICQNTAAPFSTSFHQRLCKQNQTNPLWCHHEVFWGAALRLTCCHDEVHLDWISHFMFNTIQDASYKNIKKCIPSIWGQEPQQGNPDLPIPPPYATSSSSSGGIPRQTTSTRFFQCERAAAQHWVSPYLEVRVQSTLRRKLISAAYIRDVIHSSWP